MKFGPVVEAKNPETVKEWITTIPHHIGEALDFYKKSDPKPEEVRYLRLTGGSFLKGYKTLYIPREILKQCHMKPSDNDGFMYTWDETAEVSAK